MKNKLSEKPNSAAEHAFKVILKKITAPANVPFTILLATGIAYYSAYFYELGYLRYFRIDSLSIRVGHEALIFGFSSFVIGISVLIFLVLKWVYFVNTKLENYPKTASRIIYWSFLAFILIAFQIISNSPYFEGSWLNFIMFILLCLMIGFDLGSAIASDRKNEENTSIETNKPLSMNASGAFALSIMSFYFLIGIAVPAYGFGYYRANQERTFKVILGSEGLVVVREYGELLVIKEVAEKNDIRQTTKVIYKTANDVEFLYKNKDDLN